MSHAGALLTETAWVTGLAAGLSGGLARWQQPRAVHDPGKTVLDLAVAVAFGGDCLADAGALRAEPALFGAVASDPVISQLVTRLAADAPAALKAMGQARAAARARAWQLADGQTSGSGGLITVDIDATIVTAHSKRERAAPTWNETSDFHQLTVFADHGPDGSGEPLAIVLRPGNAGSNTAADHVAATNLALAQLQARTRRRCWSARTPAAAPMSCCVADQAGPALGLLGGLHHHRRRAARRHHDPGPGVDAGPTTATARSATAPGSLS